MGGLVAGRIVVANFIRFNLLLSIMKREVAVASKLLQQRQLEKNNTILLHKLKNIKYSNISSLKLHHHHYSPFPHPNQHQKIPNSSLSRHNIQSSLVRDRVHSESRPVRECLLRKQSTASACACDEERQKSAELVRNIGKYADGRVRLKKLNAMGEQFGGKVMRSKTVGDIQQSERINITQPYNRHSPQLQAVLAQERRQHVITLFSRLVQLNNNWYQLSYLRYKNYYEIILEPYPGCQFDYRVRLEEEIGTAMLSQNDYDYELIYNNFIQFISRSICFTFELASPHKKKYFYCFGKKHKQETTCDSINFSQKKKQSNSNQLKEVKMNRRKTVFELQKEQSQKLRQQSERSHRTQSNNHSIPHRLRRLETVSTIDIRIPT